MLTSLTRYAAPVVLAGLIALTGCSATDSPSSDGSGPPQSVQADRDVDEATAGDLARAPAAGQSALDSGKANRTAPQSQAVISTGTISLRSDDVGQARFDLAKVLDAHKATIAEETASVDDDGTAARTRLVVRVPVAEFSDAMAELGEVADLTFRAIGRAPATDIVMLKMSYWFE